MTDRDVVERIGALLGRAVVPGRRRRPHHKVPYVTTMRGAPAVELMRAARPFLGLARQRQIDRAINSWHGRRVRATRQWRAVSLNSVIAGVRCGAFVLVITSSGDASPPTP
jgi:hypothetical protein